MIVKPGPVVDFLLANQKVDHPNKIDWGKVKFLFNLLMISVHYALYLSASVPCLTL
jgi:eukaryotic translation initiation factor 2C